MLADPHVGDRDPRTEDRQLLLDALLAADRPADRHLHRQRRAHEHAAAARRAGRRAARRDRPHASHGDARAQVVVRHPLQPFDPRNFAPGALGGDAAWSFDRVTLDGARALAGDRGRAARRSSPARCRRGATPVVELDDLVRFVAHPVRAFLRQRLGISVGDYADEVDDALPVELDGLERWSVGERLLDARLAGVDGRRRGRGRDRARRRCRPARSAEPVIDEVLPDRRADRRARAEPLPDGDRRGSVDVRVALPDGRPLTGTVAGVHGDAAADRHLLARRTRGTGSRPGCGCSRSPPRTRTARSRRRRSAARSTARRGTTVTVARLPRMAPDVRARAPRRARRPVRPRHARAAAAVRARPRPPTRRPCATGATRSSAAATEWESAWNFAARGRSEPEHQLVRRSAADACRRPTSCWARERRASAATRAGCGTALLGCEQVAYAMTAPFDICGPLPTGVTVLEASAGTGKTYTIAALAARYVAEGVPLEQLLLVTFTRMATGELRERVRERLVSAEHGLERALAGAPTRTTTRSSRCSPPAAPTRSRSAARGSPRALADFDAATIATTHGFCQEVLGGLGDRRRRRARHDVRRGRRATCVDEVVDDLYVRRFARARRRRRSTAREALRDRARPRSPTRPRRSSRPTRPTSTIAGDARPARAAPRARSSSARKRRAGVMTYDDLLTRLRRHARRRRAARWPPRGCARATTSCSSTSSRTPTRCSGTSCARAFGDGERDARADRRPEAGDLRVPRRRRLRLPRGRADGRHARRRSTVNWRSDQGLIDAYDALFDGAQLGHEGIVYRQRARGRRDRRRACTARRTGAAAGPGRPARRASA